MARMLVVVLLAACAAGSVLGQLPGMPMPEVCSGPAEMPVPRTDLNWPANQTKLANELHQLDQSKVSDNAISGYVRLVSGHRILRLFQSLCIYTRGGHQQLLLHQDLGR